MIQSIFLISIGLALVLVAGCASYGTANATQKDYNVAVAEAKKSLKIANSANYEWRDSGKILGKAEKSAESGDFPTATKLANQAEHQGILALAQSKEQENAGPR
ncbi:MAG: hypothetical protein KAI17_05820 [Thiotrichaceae bacterium]|nr:hypothetical protein [Thiotrichaceae bacterium]